MTSNIAAAAIDALTWPRDLAKLQNGMYLPAVAELAAVGLVIIPWEDARVKKQGLLQGIIPSFAELAVAYGAGAAVSFGMTLAGFK